MAGRWRELGELGSLHTNYEMRVACGRLLVEAFEADTDPARVEGLMCSLKRYAQQDGISPSLLAAVLLARMVADMPRIAAMVNDVRFAYLDPEGGAQA